MDPAQHTLAGLNYFSAYMNWHPEREARHREYIKAIEWSGAKAVLGRFKEKDAYCKSCRSTYRAREEKE
jgi:cytochrome c556